MSYDHKKTARIAFRDSLPVMAGYIVLGIGFGILMTAKGFAWYWSLLMSIMVFAGSMQYLAVDLLSGGVSLLMCAVMALVVNARHIFYGITMLIRYKDMGKAKPYLMFALSDETFSICCSADLADDVDPRQYYLMVSGLDQLYWIIGSVVGAVLFTLVQFDSAGVEFSMTALFVVTMISQWEKSKNHIPALTGLVVTAICLLIFGSGNFLIPSMIVITVLLLVEKRIPVLKKYFEKEVDHAS